MGKQMDEVQTVSALAMALAVAWADWVMRCCRVGSVAMSQSQMVRKTWGAEKMLISQKVLVTMLSNLHSTFLLIIGHATTSASASWHCYNAISIGIFILRFHLGSRRVSSHSVTQITWKDTPFCVP